AVYQQLWPEYDARLGQCPLISGKALKIGLRPETVSNEPNPAMTEINEILRCFASCRLVVNRNRMDLIRILAVIDQHNRHLCFRDKRNVESSHARGCHENTFDAPLLKRTNDCNNAIRVRLRIRKKDRITIFIRGLLNRANYFPIEWIG